MWESGCENIRDSLPNPSTLIPFEHWPAGFVSGFVKLAVKEWDEPIKKSMDLGNSILEIGELKSLGSAFKELAFSLSSAKNLVKFGPGGLVNLFLEYNFGVRPLIQDAKDLLSSYETILKRLAYLRITRGREAKYHFTRVYPVYSGPPDPATLLDPLGHYPFTIVEGTYRLSSTATVFQNLEDLDGVDGYLRAFTAYGGLNNPIHIAWNAIPYSFVVDWFLHVGEHLEGLALPVFPGHGMEVRDIVTSAKQKWTAYECLWESPGYNGWHALSVYECERYWRFRGLPPDPDNNLSGLTPFQQLLAAALAWQRYVDPAALYESLKEWYANRH